jgi:hypothetical protein
VPSRPPVAAPATAARTVARRVVAGLAALALVASPAACSSGDDGSSPTTRPGPTTTTVPPPPEPRLLDPGSEPRRVLRSSLVQGGEVRAAITTDLAIEQGGEVDGAAIDPPPITEVVDYRVGRVAEREATVSFRFAEVRAERVGDALTDAEHLELTEGLQGLVGVAGTGRSTDRGSLAALELDLPDDLDPAVATQLRLAEEGLAALGVPLPREAVGVGARWRVTDRVTSSGVAVRRTTTYEISSLDGDRVGYTATVTLREVEPGPVDAPGLPDGLDVELISADGTASIRGTLDLGSPVSPARGETHVRQVLEVTAEGGPPTRVTQDIDVALAVRVPG